MKSCITTVFLFRIRSRLWFESCCFAALPFAPSCASFGVHPLGPLLADFWRKPERFAALSSSDDRVVCLQQPRVRQTNASLAQEIIREFEADAR